MQRCQAPGLCGWLLRAAGRAADSTRSSGCRSTRKLGDNLAALAAYFWYSARWLQAAPCLIGLFSWMKVRHFMKDQMPALGLKLGLITACCVVFAPEHNISRGLSCRVRMLHGILVAGPEVPPNTHHYFNYFAGVHKQACVAHYVYL